MFTEELQNLGASAEAIQQYYDTGNDFYHLWLDENMIYSCGLWEPQDTLETAQMRQVDYHIAQSRAQGAKRVLDIGCGWGTTLRRLVETYHVEHAIGLNLSRTQVDWMATSPDPHIEVRLEDWFDHQPTAPYDAIIAVEILDHCATMELSEAEKITAYTRFFQRCHEWLKPGGWMTLQVHTYGTMKPEELRNLPPEILAELEEFEPESELPCLSEILAAIAPTFELVELRNDRHDALQTHQAWLERLQANRAAAVKLTNEATVTQFEHSLQYASFCYISGAANLLRLTLRRIDHPWHDYLDGSLSF